jgi:SAM-dependent methyltransferase
MPFVNRALNRLLYRCWKLISRYRSRSGERWFTITRPEFLKEADQFLHREGLLAPGDRVDTLAQHWSSYVTDLFSPASPESFYSSWTGAVGASNIAANILDQFSRPYLATTLMQVLGKHHQFDGILLDYGCGTGALSLSWQRSFARRSSIFLADVENLPREFTRFYKDRHPEYVIELHDVGLETVLDESVDCVICVHVLEHLSNPSEVFSRINRTLKHGGSLILEAPWGGHPEHLEQSPVDWETNGGRNLLEKEYRLVRRMNWMIPLSGVYRKTVDS